MPPPPPDVKFVEIDSLAGYRRFTWLSPLRSYRIRRVEDSLRGRPLPFRVPGFCKVCGKKSEFKVTMRHLRETLECKRCKLNNRMRACFHFFGQQMKPLPDSAIYLTEQVTRLFAAFSAKYGNITGSEYLGSRIPFGSTDENGIRNESLTQLTFAPSSFDYILSFEVFEHIPDWQAAFRECARALKPGGKLIFTVPFIKASPVTVIRARVTSSGEIEHLLPAEYHGDPINEAGCLCFQHFGWDMLGVLERSGFQKARAWAVWSAEHAYLAGNPAHLCRRKITAARMTPEHPESYEELARRLDTRLAELAAAHLRIEEGRENARALKETKRKLKETRAERDALRGSLEYRLGRKLVLPFRKLGGKIFGKKTAPVFTAAAAGESKTAPSYHQWFLAQRPTPEAWDAMRREAASLAEKPLVSILTPVFDTPLAMLSEAVESVRAQVYENWELILLDNASTDARIPPALAAWCGKDPRIKATRLAQNSGIAAASNAALALARGEFVGLLDHDDLLEPDALLAAVQALAKNPGADLVYSDEDKIDETGLFQKPFFKPDWSPDALLSNNYLCHFTVIRRALLEEIGGFRAGFDGAQDYDLFLRATERARAILHVPRVLYHWRISGHSTSSDAAQKPEAIDAGARALSEALARRGIRGRVEPTGKGARYRVRRELAKPEKIAILIPTKDRADLLARCLESITALTDYPDFEIVVIDNDSEQPETARYFKNLPPRARVLRYPGPFNFSALNNFAVRQTSAPWLLFLNNDTEILHADWLTNMAEHAQRPEVGAVGAKLLFPDGTVQHAGVVLAEKNLATHAFLGAPGDSFENGGQLQMARNYSAVTAACLLMRREVFGQVGGFDEKALAVAYNDVDLCLRLRAAGFQIVYTPFAQVRHHESVSRGYGRANPLESRLMRERWAGVIAHDPFHNENLARAEGAFSFR